MLRLKALGVRLALDDFGTGYSSLLYLRRFPFDKLKIDRASCAASRRPPTRRRSCMRSSSLGRGLGMKVTAEGVETAEQHLFLRAAGVHSMQGYRFGEPARADEISARHRRQARRAGIDGDAAALAGLTPAPFASDRTSIRRCRRGRASRPGCAPLSTRPKRERS